MIKPLKIAMVFLTYVFFSIAHAQENLPKFGQVDIADLQMKECSFDKGAGAMYLINYENATVNHTFTSYYVDIEKWVRIKIFSRQGFEQATISIPYDARNGNTHIKEISAKTYNLNENGEIETVTVESKDIFTGKMSKDEGNVRFAFPNVKLGSVIELRYIEQKDFSLYLEPWLVQDVIPSKLSMCKLNYSGSVDILAHIKSKLPVTVNSDTALSGDIVTTYTANNIMQFNAEPMMTSVKDNLQHIDFAIIPANYYWNSTDSITIPKKWGYFISKLFKLPVLGSQIGKEPPGTAEDIKLIKKLLTKEEKIAAVYDYVQKNVKWNNGDDFLSADIAQAWNNKAGNKSEINLLMVNLLDKVGVKAYPLLVSTRENGRVDVNFPGYGQFNGIDVLIDNPNLHYVIDATQKYQSYKIPPYDILNRYALVADKENCRWLYVADNRQLMKNYISVKAAIDTAGTMKGEVSIAYYDYAKADALNKAKGGSKDDSKDFLQDEITDLKIDSVKQENEDDVEKPLIKSFQLTLAMEQTGDFYFLDPFFLSPFRKNPFIDSVRQTDVDFGCNQLYAINMFISLPNNIAVAELPTNKEIRLADSSFSFGRTTTAQGSTLAVRIHFEILNPIFTAGEYPFLKQVFEKVYALLNERIVFKKTN